MTRENRRLPKVFEAFEALGVEAEAVVYNDACRHEVRQQLSDGTFSINSKGRAIGRMTQARMTDVRRVDWG